MNRYKTGGIILVCVFIGLTAFKPLMPTFPLYITGHIRNATANSHSKLNGLVVLVKGDGKLLAKSVADTKGNFNMTFTPERQKRFNFYCTRPGCDTLLIGSFTAFDTDSEEMTFYVPLIEKKYTSGMVLCPDTKKADKVRKVAGATPQ
jgi:hypothetical protein